MTARTLEPSTGRLASDEHLQHPRHDGIDPDASSSTSHAYDDLDDDSQRWSTWLSVEPLCRGPEPRPDWVVTSAGAIDTELGILKTGKEADVFLARAGRPARPRRRGRHGRQALPQQRAPHLPPGGRLHRGPQHEALPRRARPQAQEHLGQASSPPASGRSRSGTRSSASGTLGLPVPYPVQIDGTEILMEWITVDGEHRAAAGADPAGARRCWRRTSTSCATPWPRMVQHGVVHGDLSAYNILAAGERLVIIDLPQIVDLVGNLNGHGLPAARLHQRLRAGSGPAGSRSTSTSCSGS